ncbi:hypothetical protein [Clostridium botulinum]|uniref:hypothetical protein n=1 Tax=Clostridium botulinum TaxID=1491 RepID=UPI0007732613|nr:hypothetical protein [Clostridium botulinum]NFL36822.1 hypothetical protein [Clostridium botulinum]NFL64498.1 hypothetical protein [Clostridium botulinum]NFN06624.1 hypothetical protein [Clostridium botulinum]NFN23488.1 hypothetical protein [Clostridium botulinum]NFN30226.1 hypothetical protein [Clostridium botulinum]
MSLLFNCNKVAFKFLSSVEIDNYGSNQHELHGSRAFKDLFGFTKKYLNGTIYYIANGGSIQSFSTSLTWYDAREFANNDRSEFRFYYTHEISAFSPQIGDILLISQDINYNVIIVLINDSVIKSSILQNLNRFTSYEYTNGSSYSADLKNVPFLMNII